MSRTTLTITQPTKERLEQIRDRDDDLRSLDATIRHVLTKPIEDNVAIRYAETESEPATINIQQNTQSWLEQRLETDDDIQTYDDLIRTLLGADRRDRGEESVEWKPL